MTEFVFDEIMVKVLFLGIGVLVAALLRGAGYAGFLDAGSSDESDGEGGD